MAIEELAVEESRDDDAFGVGTRLETARSPSPYRRRNSLPGVVKQSWGSIAIHGVAWVAAATWLLAHSSTTFDQPVVGTLVFVGTFWLLVGPTFVVAWERKLALLAARRFADCPMSVDERARLAAVVRRLDRVRPIFLLVPMLVMAAAYVGAASFQEDHAFTQWTAPYVIGFFIIQLGSLAGGWGLWAAAKTLALAMTIAKQPCDFAPFAGVTSRSGHSLARFCFWSALIFGVGASVLLPGISATAWETEGIARAALFVVIGYMTVTSVLLLALPAWALSRQYETERTEFLDRLAERIDGLATAVADKSQQFTSDQYARLRGLLELRAHVVDHSMSQSSVEMVKRIPIAVLLPVSSTIAAWLSLVA